MSRPDLPEDSRWTSPVGSHPIEERPYRECPNCGRFKYRWKFIHGSLLGPRADKAWQECGECKYREEPDDA